MQKQDGSFHNYLAYSRNFLDVDGSEDSAGRALWACGATVNSKLPEEMRLVAKDLFGKGLARVWKTTHLRFIASTILGLKEYYLQEPAENIKTDAAKLAAILVEHFTDETRDDWRWFEPNLTYDNARLPQALFAAYTITGERAVFDVAKDSMEFLLETQLLDGVFVPIGSNGWYRRGGERAFYDQQPIEASATVDAAVEAYGATGDQRYLQVADDVFGWFLGQNSCKLMMYNPQTSGCCDGLSPDKVNLNQGAESSICFLLARMRLEEAQRGMLG